MIYSEAILSALNPPEPRPIWEWAGEFIELGRESPYPGRFNIQNSPWIKQPLEDLQDIRCRSLTCMSSAQSGKTMLLEIFVAWLVSEDPSPTLWVMSTADEAKRLSREKLMPLLERCPPVKDRMPTDRFKKSTFEILFDTMPFWIVSAGGNSQAALASKSIRNLILDEVALYKAGSVDKVLKRVSAYWSHRIVLVSCPTRQQDEIHRQFLRGNQNLWWVKLPCGHEAQLQWRSVKWNHVKSAAGETDWEATKKTVGFECPTCKVIHLETNQLRKSFTQNGYWKANNPNADIAHRSYCWTALLPEWISIKDTLVPEFIQATAALKTGNVFPLRNFINERIPDEPWKEADAEVDNSSELLGTIKGNYKPEDVQGGVRYIGCDVQQTELFAVCREFNSDGSSRLIWASQLPDFEALERERVRLKVESRKVLLDSGYSASEVYSACQRFKFTPTKGEPFPHYISTDRKGNQSQQLYRVTTIDPFAGTAEAGRKSQYLILFATDSVMDWLDRFMRGKAAPWLTPSEGIPMEYFRQINAASKRPKADARGNIVWQWHYKKSHDHYLAAEKIAFVAALVEGWICADTVLPPSMQSEQALTPAAIVN